MSLKGGGGKDRRPPPSVRLFSLFLKVIADKQVKMPNVAMPWKNVRGRKERSVIERLPHPLIIRIIDNR